MIDTNSLITPHMHYYPFDLAPVFWQQMEKHIKGGSIKILDMVRDEVLRGGVTDNLTLWMQGLGVAVIDHREPEIIAKYRDVLDYLQTSDLYKPNALNEWARRTVADPWLIATAAAHDYTIITFEQHSGGLSPKTKNKLAKIPDVADVFGVKTQELYYLMRELDIKLS